MAGEFTARLGSRKRHPLSVSVFRIGLILLLLVSALAAADTATRMFRAGERAQRAGDSLQAYQLYARAALLEPSNAAYALHRNLLRDWAEP